MKSQTWVSQKKKKKKKLLNSSFQESLHFFFYRFSFLAAAFVFSAQQNMISESVLGPVARIKMLASCISANHGYVKFHAYVSCKRAVFSWRETEGTMGSFALGETAAGRQNRVMLQTVGTCGSRLYNKETEYFFKRSL